MLTPFLSPHQIVSMLAFNENVPMSAALCLLSVILGVGVEVQHGYFVAYTSNKQLSDLTGSDERTVRRHISSLVNLELSNLLITSDAYGQKVELDIIAYLNRLQIPRTVGGAVADVSPQMVNANTPDTTPDSRGDILACTHPRGVEHRPAVPVPVPPKGGTGTARKEQSDADTREDRTEAMKLELARLNFDKTQDDLGIEGSLERMQDVLSIVFKDCRQSDALRVLKTLKAEFFEPWQSLMAVTDHLTHYLDQGKHLHDSFSIGWLTGRLDIERMKQRKFTRQPVQKMVPVYTKPELTDEEKAAERKRAQELIEQAWQDNPSWREYLRPLPKPTRTLIDLGSEEEVAA